MRLKCEVKHGDCIDLKSTQSVSLVPFLETNVLGDDHGAVEDLLCFLNID